VYIFVMAVVVIAVPAPESVIEVTVLRAKMVNKDILYEYTGSKGNLHRKGPGLYTVCM
jgi:hypothetical protein